MTATRGELGTADPATWPPERLGAERAVELADCLSILGVREHHWLGTATADAPRRTRRPRSTSWPSSIAQIRPDTVVTFGPDGMTGHPDHQTVSAWTGAAFAAAAGPGARLLHAAITDRHAERWSTLAADLDVYARDIRC